MTPLFNNTTTADQVLEGIDLSHKRFLVTGGNSGLGQEAARALAQRGAAIILTARDQAKGDAAAGLIREQVPGADIHVRILDLASLANVRAFTDALRRDVCTLDGILANAGIMATDEARTVDGFESQFGTNHLGHFVMVNRLADLLTPGSRVVIMSSGAHRLHDVDLADPNFKFKPYDRWDAYGQSKSGNALFALAFDRRWQGRNVRAFAVAPGIIKDTNLHHHLTEEHFQVLRSRQFTGALPRKSLAAGAATPVYALVHPSLKDQGGRFLEDCNFARVNPDTRQAEGVIPWVLDEAHAERVWMLSEELVGEKFPQPAGQAVSGLAGNRLPPSNAFDERELALVLEDGGRAAVQFGTAGRCRWTGLPGFDLDASGSASADVVEAAPGVYFIDLLLDGSEKETVMIALDLRSGRALVTATAMGERTSRPAGRVSHALTTRFRQRFTTATLDGAVVSGEAPALTRDLIGMRALYVYGPDTVYEHVYLSSDWYAYNSIKGMRRGDAGCDEITVHKLAHEVYVLAWREILIDIAAVFIYDMKGLRTTGKAWGTPGAEPGVRNIPAGASIQILGRTSYPKGMEPA
ncbi:MAG TPA: SDR family NAD(P)-dependent oxidoreductase [Burkholderiaceae bacterium]|nr:SDR family NAD(P)-dependent oxidoreductase [Burkholderiaceae bacterium]